MKGNVSIQKRGTHFSSWILVTLLFMYRRQNSRLAHGQLGPKKLSYQRSEQ
jgi:hypothetical protein